MSMYKSPHKRGGRKPIRYTRNAAQEAFGRYKAHYDHQPGVVFKDPQGGLHTVPPGRKFRNKNRSIRTGLGLRED